MPPLLKKCTDLKSKEHVHVTRWRRIPGVVMAYSTYVYSPSMFWLTFIAASFKPVYQIKNIFPAQAITEYSFRFPDRSGRDLRRHQLSGRSPCFRADK